MKKLLFLLFVGFAFQVQAQSFFSQYDQLVSVNEQWKNQPDVNSSLKTTAAKALSEQQLVLFHLQEVEKLLRKRAVSHVSPQLKQQRQKLLDVLHGYIETGVFPINDLHQKRQPYFIDKYNTYCAVGYLMKMSGADNMARDIHNTQNYSYLFDIKHPQLLEWANGSGFTLGELALIQPSYGGEVPTTLTEMHYNNIGTDVNEYIEIRQSTGQLVGMPGFDSVIFVNAAGVVYKRLPIASMTAAAYNSFYYYTFPTSESFADVGSILIKRLSSFSPKDTVSYITYDASTVTIKNYLYNSFTTTTYNTGESETTPVGNSLGFTGTWGTASWNLVAGSNSMGIMNPGIQFPTPIVLSKLDYTVVNKQVNLNWETVSEINNKYFAIEKSTDGTNFYEIGRVNVAGTSSSVKQYSFTDNKPSYINQYRLKQVDFDGKTTNSKIVYVKVQQAASIVLKQNIVSSHLEVLVQNEVKGNISLYDFSGKLIKQVQATTGKQSIDVSTFNAGSYLLSWKPNTGEVVNLVFQKIN